MKQDLTLINYTSFNLTKHLDIREGSESPGYIKFTLIQMTIYLRQRKYEFTGFFYELRASGEQPIIRLSVFSN